MNLSSTKISFFNYCLFFILRFLYALNYRFLMKKKSIITKKFNVIESSLLSTTKKEAKKNQRR